MGMQSRLSTPGNASRYPAAGENGFFEAAFSGKLSPVTSNSADQVQTMRSAEPAAGDQPATPPATDLRPRELGGRDGPEPTRFGDWELRGRCIDF
jgi:hypothetical protein